MTTSDYLLLGSLFTQNGHEHMNKAQFGHLTEFEIVRLTENDIELAGSDITMLIGT